MKFLDQRAAFRLLVRQLAIPEVDCS